MAELDYIGFRDSVIVALADEQEPPGLGSIEVSGLCKRHGISFHETWLQTIGPDMAQLGWGTDRSTLKERSFLINGSGLARAVEVRNARKPLSLKDRIAAVTRSEWISVLALFVSAIALLKGN